MTIVGGGMLGMTLALRLNDRGAEVTILEAAPDAGGLAAPWREGDITWDKFYHVILLSDLHLRSLLAELKLEDALCWGETRTGFLTDGTLYSLSNSLEFLRFPPLRLADKLRLAATIEYAARVTDWRRLEGVPVTDWLRRLSGRRTYEKIWAPLLRAKLGDAHTEASAAFIWVTIQRMYAARRTGMKREMFGYVRGGYRTVVDALVSTLATRGITFRFETDVRQITRAGGEVVVELANGPPVNTDAVVLTAPCPIVSRACPQLTPAERARLDGVRYLGIACPSLLLKRPISPYYVTNITDESPFTGVIEMTALVDRAEVGGRSLVYLPRYLTQDDPDWGLSDAALRTRTLDALERMYPGFARDDVEAFQIARARYVMALPTLNYSTQGVPPTATSVPGVFVVNGSQIVNGTLNVNETVALANRKAHEIALSLGLDVGLAAGELAA